MKGRHDFFASPGKSAAARDPQDRPGRTGIPIAGPFVEPSQLSTFAEINSEYLRLRAAKKESVFTAKTGDAEKIRALKNLDTGMSNFAASFESMEIVLTKFGLNPATLQTAIILRYPIRAYVGAERILESIEELIKFIQQIEFTIYKVKIHPNAAPAETASAQRETIMVDVLEFTRVKDSAEFDHEPRPGKFFILAGAIPKESLAFVKVEAFDHFDIELDLLTAPSRTGTADPPVTFEAIGMQWMKNMIAQQIAQQGNHANSASRRTGSSPIRPFDLTGFGLDREGPRESENLPTHTPHRSDKEKATDSQLLEAKPLYSPARYDYLYGKISLHPNTVTARTKLNSSLSPQNLLESRVISSANIGPFGSFMFIETPISEMFTNPGSDGGKIDSSKSFDDFFLFLEIAFTEMGHEYGPIIQRLHASATNLIRRFPSLQYSQVLVLINRRFCQLRTECVNGRLGKHPVPDTERLECDPRVVSDILFLDAASDLTRLMVETANVRVTDELQKKLTALSVGREKQPTKEANGAGRGGKPRGTDPQPAATRNTGNRGGGAAASAGVPSTRPQGPPFVPGGPFCYYQFKSGRPCFGKTTCVHTIPRTHGWPTGTDTALIAAFIAWVSANIN